ncbi:MAG: sulfatase-like hydrolase/transferase [Verrucomicrobiales bacterium]|nr:sulfatase-like hydrolase/transferase [Verrucomicrobiales bacterium]
MRLLRSLLLTAAVLATSCLSAAERPNVILILADDLGFSDLGFQGGEIHTPHLDALAAGGVRFSQFYNSGRCCPTRATLVTGLHPHQTGIGHMTIPSGGKEKPGVPPAYQGHLNEQCVTLAQVMQRAGYATMMTGKWHLGPLDQKDWPLQRGFEKYYGCIDGALRYFHPHGTRIITSGNDPVENPASTTEDAFYTTDAFTDHAIGFLQEEAAGQDRPTFLYLAFNAPHWPLQAFEEDIAKYRGKYRMGWEKLRRQRYARQQELGLIDPQWELSPPTEGIPTWDSLDEKKQDEMDLKMAIYAAMVDRLDQNVGKLVSYLKASGRYDNTLILFLSDNGACQEGGELGRGEFFDVEKRNLEDSNSYGEAWANAGSTPFRLYKHFAHEGGTATPFFMHWPAHIAARADWYPSPAQLIDIMPTLIDVAGGSYPTELDGKMILPIDGISLRPAFSGQPLQRGAPLFIEHETNAFVRDGDWKLVGREVAEPNGVDPSHWELYNLKTDRTELHNLAAEMPEKVASMSAQWDTWAQRVHVYPKTNGEKAAAGEPQADPHPPQIKGRAFTVRATVRGKDLKGTVLSQGGVRFGWSLHFQQGRPTFTLRDAGKLTEIASPRPFSGKVELEARLDADTMSLRVNGQEVARRKSPGLLSDQPGLGKYTGLDFRDPVGNYTAPNPFSGRVLEESVEVVIPKVTMRTRWGRQVTPENAWRAYPRPQFERPEWINLNGPWDYAVTPGSASAAPASWQGKILVPFAIESPLSGVERRITPDDALWYQRAFDVTPQPGHRLQLNFEAVDYACTVWVNDQQVGTHTGGNLPFSFDITAAARPGTNTLRLRVTDATDTAYQLHGKQVLNPGGIWYTPVSGIWQTVWLEQVPDAHLAAVKITPKMDGTVTLQFKKKRPRCGPDRRQRRPAQGWPAHRRRWWPR